MKGITSVGILALFPLLLTQGCNCGRPSVRTDAGVCSQADTCGACPPGCTNVDTCGADGGWACACTCQVTAASVCDDYARRACDFFIRCHAEQSLFFDASEGRGPSLPGTDTDQVAVSERARCEARISKSMSCGMVLESFKAGRTTFDPVAYSACTAALYPAASCSRDLNVLQELCLKTSFVTAATATSGPCQSDGECVNGWCNASGAGACGTCQPYLAPGAGACARDAQCDPSSTYCSSSAGGCSPYLNDGASCSVTELSGCGPTRQCVISGFLTTTCATGKAEGEACTPNRYQCKRSGRALPELLCEVSSGGAAGTCVKLQSAPGGRCGDGEQIIPSASGNGVRGPLCPETQYCQNNTCVPRKGAAASCSANEECAAGLRCVGSSGAMSCQPFQDLNQPCGAATDCKDLLSCDATSKGCIPNLALDGEACSSSVGCAEGYCQAGATQTCAAYKGSGMACASNGECRSNVCSTTCQPACWQAP
jgi:hypothetical protein